MRALVTGGTGFIGRGVVDLLLEGNHTVRLFSRRTSIPQRWGKGDIEVFEGDLEDLPSVARAMEGVDVFYHVGEIKNVSKPASLRNVRLVEKITGWLPEKGVRRFVFVSSITVAGIPSSIPATEETRPSVILGDHYTYSKGECERCIADNSGAAQYVVIRPAPVYGPGSRYLGRILDVIRTLGPVGLPFPGAAKNLAPLIYVKDLARAIYLSGVREEAANQIFNITDGIRHSWLDFLEAVAKLSGRKVRIVSLPHFLFKFPSFFVDIFSEIFGFQFDMQHYVDFFSKDVFFDNAKAKKMLEWEPDYCELTEGVKEMLVG